MFTTTEFTDGDDEVLFVYVHILKGVFSAAHPNHIEFTVVVSALDSNQSSTFLKKTNI